MGHQIEAHGTAAAAVFARQDAWHRLGTVVRDRAFTAEEAMRLGHLGGWGVRTAPLQTVEVGAEGVTTLEVPGFATVRTNPFTGAPEALGVVGSQYVPLQNEEHAEFLNLLAEESGAVFETAGSLRGGRQVFLTMRLPETMKVGGTDQVDLNIAALNSHDGSTAFRLLVTPVRVVCANTQHAALRNHSASVAIRHTVNAKAMVAQARDALGLTFDYLDAFEREAEQMIQTEITRTQFEELIQATFAQPRPDQAQATGRRHTQDAVAQRTATLWSLYEDAETQDGIRGTAWGAYQAVAEYADHFAPVRTHGDAATARALRVLTSHTPAQTKRAAWAHLTGAGS